MIFFLLYLGVIVLLITISSLVERHINDKVNPISESQYTHWFKTSVMGMTKSTLLNPADQQELIDRKRIVPRDKVNSEADTYARFKKRYPDKEEQQ